MRKSVFLLLFYPMLLLGQTDKLTIDDVLSAVPTGSYGREHDNEPTPDGKYTVVQERGQIVLKPTDGGQEEVLTSSPQPKSELALSPDGREIAYVSQGQVWVSALAGGEPLQLTHDAAGPGDPRGATDHRPQWNPDSRWILYESGSKGYNELNVVSEDGKVRNLLVATEIYHGKDIIASTSPDKGDAVSSDRFDPRPLWSPDGNHISYTERSREFFSGKLKVLAFDRKTGSAIEPARDIYIAKNDPGGAWAINTVAWSPDNKTLAVILQETSWDKIWLIPSAGGTPKQLTFGSAEDEEPVYSPDGRWIAFVSNRGIPEERHIWVIPAVGGEPHRLSNLAGFEIAPVWSSDSQHIRFQWRSTLGASGTYSAEASGKEEPRLLGSISHSKFERIGITPEVVRYKGRDGLPLAGILYKPIDYRADLRYPTVILAHGGPESQVTLSITPWSLFLADQGYVVLEPNFRGSTGYGERFRNANVEDSGGGEIDDIAASVQYLVDSGLTDPKRVGISGGSHGGTVVANAVTKYPELFAVGIEKFGVVDRELFLQYTNRNSAIRWETKMGGPPKLRPTVYRKANVLPDVGRIKAPLLILHGEVDPQVPPQESQEFAAALKSAGKIFTYITYPNEGHGFQQREHRKDADERELAFLNLYLKPDSAR
jgi:dipeptidyl aminopeptidase/acylaminoacyl peptidase